MIQHLKNNSKLQESIAEYAFLKDLLVDGVRNKLKVLISRSDFDAVGYDVLVQLENDEKVIKLQLKATNWKANVLDIHKSLLEDENGNVILIKIKDDTNNDLSFEYYTILSPKNDFLVRNPNVSHPKNVNKNFRTWQELTKNEFNPIQFYINFLWT